MTDGTTLLKRALTEIESLRARVAELAGTTSRSEPGATKKPGVGGRATPIAVIGMGCRLPGGVFDPDGFWDLLAGGVDATRTVPEDRWPSDEIYAADATPGKAYVRRGGYLDNVCDFDPAFFGLSPRETQRMDPQQRLLLETHWEALERAGLPIESLVGSTTGVFVGNTASDFSHLQMKYVDLALLDGHYVTGNFPSFLAGRIAFHFGLQGPTLAVDTACSSSLVAVHLACQSLGHGECELALASGVNLMLFPELNASLCGARMLAADGRCKTFDASADGYARAEGCAALVLKRLDDAAAHGDPILAVLPGTAINHDGRSSGITVPNGAAQQAVVRQALARAGVRPNEIDYVEAHGTGTSLGDPIEVRALGAVLGQDRDEPLLIGSVKTNIGHLEAAAGIAGLMKVILALDRQQIPPHLNLDALNPAIDLASIPARIPTVTQAWPRHGDQPRVAGVSSFGASGTNAHVIVTSPPVAARVEEIVEEGEAKPGVVAPSILVLSARDEDALRQLAGRFAEHLEEHPEQSLADVCHTANLGRPALRHRLAVQASSTVDMTSRLTAVALGERRAGIAMGALPRRARRWGKGGAPVAFLFTGQGAQYPDMGRALYDAEAVFRRTIKRCDAGLRTVLDLPLVDVLYGARQAELNQTVYTQPSLFAVELALAELWASWGVTPTAVVGHSVGEYVAACVAGVLTVEGALQLIGTRGRLMQALPAGGAMAAVALSEEAARAAVIENGLDEQGAKLSIAALNGPESTVLSGARDAVEAVVAALAARDVRVKALDVSHAFHSQLMEPMLADLAAAASGVTVQPPQLDVIANLTGTLVDGNGAVSMEEGGGEALVFGSGAYWRRHARQPVRFADSMTTLRELGIEVLLEIGPAPTLLGMAKACLGDGDDAPALVPSLRQGRDDREQMAHGVGALFARGATVDWHGVDGGRRRNRVALPTYPFQRQRFWIEPHELASNQTGTPTTSMANDARPLHPFLVSRILSPLPGALYTAAYSTARQRLLGDFSLFGHVVVNIGVYVEAFAAATRDALGLAMPVIDDIAMPQALLLDGDTQAERLVQVVLGDERDGERALQLFALPAVDPAGDPSDPAADVKPWDLYASGRLRVRPETSEHDVDGAPAFSIESLCSAAVSEFDGATFYAGMVARGLDLGPAGRWIDHVWRGADEGTALARMRLPRPDDEAGHYGLHPGLIDCCFQLLYATLTVDEGDAQALFMLVGVERLRFLGWPDQASPEDTELWCQVRRDAAREGDEAGLVVAGDITLVTADGQRVLAVTGAELRRVQRETLERSLSIASRRRPRGAGAEAAGSESARRAVLETLRAAAPDVRSALARDGVVAAVAQVLGFATTEIDPEQPLNELGIDSLLALELRTALSNAVGVSPPLARILEGPTPTRLAAHLVAGMEPAEEQGGSTHDDGDGPGSATPELGGTAVDSTAVDSTAVDMSLPRVMDDPAHRHEPFPFTDLQEAYFFGRTGAFELGNISTYVTMEVEVNGLDVERLDAAWQRMIERHEMLRAKFLADGRQCILPEAPASFAIAVRDLSDLDEVARGEALVAIRDEMVAQVLPTAGWPLFDIRVSHLGDGRSRVHIGLDALVMDAWGHSILFKDWAALYHQPKATLPPLEVSFRDYALALKALETKPVYQRDLAYWQARLADLPPAPELPLAQEPSSLERPDFVRRTGRLEAPVWACLKARASAAGLTPSTMMCALYAAVLAEWSKSKHFTLNILYFNRLPLHPRANDIAANLSATILLEVDARTRRPFVEHAQALARRFWDDLEHSHVSGVRVLREYNRLHSGRAQAGMPIVFASTLALDIRQGDVPTGLFQHLLGLGGEGAVVHATARTPQVMLDHQIMEEAGALVFNWDAVESLFPPRLVDDMFAAYHDVLTRLATDDAAWTTPVGDPEVGLLPVAQRASRVRSNATEVPISEGLLHEPFLEQVASHPERLAVIAADRSLTYGELSARAHALAHRLRDVGARPNDLVGVLLEKGWPQVVATLAVGLAGGAYLPIDPGLPAARVRYLLDHGRVKVALLFGDADPLVATDDGWPAEVNRLWVDRDAPAEVPAPLDAIQNASDLAYVIFTSGSTGLPKGVMIDHRGARNTVLDVNRRFEIGPNDRVLALSALNFDLSVWDIFGVLAAGGAIVLPPPDALREPGQWTELIETHQVTVWNSVPALMEMWVDSLVPSVREVDPASARGTAAWMRLVLMSGDWIPVTLPDRIRSVFGADHDGLEVISLGGATEASIWSILYPIETVDPSWSSIPYGRPMANQRFHVLDEAFQARPDWVPGELHIAGVGVAQGYLHDAERTAASFYPHPSTGEQLYRTGDLGRYRPDGSIEFLGREDFQVKIQGYRIELGEIEVALAQQPGIAACAVVAQGAKRGSKRLVAFLVPTSGDQEEDGLRVAPEDPVAVEALVDGVRSALTEQIASYMVPAAFVVVEALPLTANGKVDRGALAVFDTASHAAGADDDRPQVGPRDEIEVALAALWQDLLEREVVGVHEDFFDLGGHSLLAVRMMATIEDRFGCRLPLATVFEGRTVEQLAAVVRDQGARRGQDDTRLGDPIGEEIVVTIQAPATVPVSPPEGTVVGSGQKPSLFCVHPVSGSVLCYAPLARALGSDQAFHGLQARATPVAPDDESLESMATDYVEAMRALQPRGPYHLAGWSMGGMVAYEMARQLHEVGERAAFVGLIDVAEAPTGPPAAVDDATLVAWFARDLAGLVGQTAGFDVEHLEGVDDNDARLVALATWAEGAGVLPPGLQRERLRDLFMVFRRNYRALLRYRPRSFDGHLTVLHVADTEVVARSWAALASSVVIEPLEGDHYSIVREPRVGALATALRRGLTTPDESVDAVLANARRLAPAGSVN